MRTRRRQCQVMGLGFAQHGPAASRSARAGVRRSGRPARVGLVARQAWFQRSRSARDPAERARVPGAAGPAGARAAPKLAAPELRAVVMVESNSQHQRKAVRSALRRARKTSASASHQEDQPLDCRPMESSRQPSSRVMRSSDAGQRGEVGVHARRNPEAPGPAEGRALQHVLSQSAADVDQAPGPARAARAGPAVKVVRSAPRLGLRQSCRWHRQWPTVCAQTPAARHCL